MAIEQIVSGIAGQHLAQWIRKVYWARFDAKLKAMPYAEKRKAVEASQLAYAKSLLPRITWRYRLGFAIGRLLLQRPNETQHPR